MESIAQLAEGLAHAAGQARPRLAVTTASYESGKENARSILTMNTKATILIVDDEESLRYTTRLILQHEGFQVTEAATGQEALRLADEEPDVIILDLHLPDVAGIEICRILKAAPRTAAIPVLHVTAVYPGAEERAESLAAGADGYVTRPLDPAQLLATIKALLARRAA